MILGIGYVNVKNIDCAIYHPNNGYTEVLMKSGKTFNYTTTKEDYRKLVKILERISIDSSYDVFKRQVVDIE